MTKQNTCRVVFVAHSQSVGGAEMYLDTVIRSLLSYVRKDSEPGLSVHLICRRHDALDSWCATLEAAGARVHRLDISRPHDLLQMWRALRNSRLVHLTLAFPFGKYQTIAALLACLAGGQVLVTHQLLVKGSDLGYGRIANALWSRVFAMYVKRCQRHIVVSEAGMQALVDTVHVDPHSITVIYNGIDTDFFRPLEPSTRVANKRQMGIELAGEDWNRDIPLVCSVGRLNVQKGFADLVVAAAEVLNAYPTARFVIIGEGELRVSLLEFIATRGLQDRIFLAGMRAQDVIASWVAAADIFVLPSYFEGFPFAVAEAMACARPVVATRVAGSSEAVVEGATGYLVPSRQPAALACAISKLLTQPRLAEEMGLLGRERAVAHFSSKEMVAQTVALFASEAAQSAAAVRK